MAFNISYIYQIIDKASGPLGKINAALKTSVNKLDSMSGTSMAAGREVPKGLAKIDKAVTKTGGVLSRFQGGLVGISNSLIPIAAGYLSFQAVKNSVVDVTTAAMEFESAMSRISRVVDLPPSISLQDMAKQVKTLATELPLTQAAIAEIVAQGGALGIPAEKLGWFAKFAAQTSVAFDMMPEDAADAMAKLSKSMNIPIDGMLKVADTINYLADNSAAHERQIVEAMYSGGSAIIASMGLTHNEAIALATTFIETGMSASEAGTRLEVLVRRLRDTQNVQKALRGISGFEDFHNLVQANPQEAIQKLFLAVNKGLIPMSKLQDLLGLYAVDFEKLGKNYENYMENLRDANNVAAQAGGLQRTYDKKLLETNAKLQIMRNNIHNIKIAIGTALLPILDKFASAISWIAQKTQALFERYPRLGEDLKMVARALAIIGAVVLAVVAALVTPFVMIAIVIGDMTNMMVKLYNIVSKFLTASSSITSLIGKIALLTNPMAAAGSLGGLTASAIAGSGAGQVKAPANAGVARSELDATIHLKGNTAAVDRVTATTKDYGNMGTNMAFAR